MKARSWTGRAAIFGTVLIVAGAFASVPAFAVGFPTSTSLESSQNPSPACGLVTFKATVSGAPFPDSPIGLVEFFDGGSTLGTAIITYDFNPDPIFGTHIIPTNHSSGTITVALSGGTHVITAAYAGSDLFSGGGPLLQNVTAATSSMSVSSSANPSVFGQPVEFDTTVMSSCGGAVAGSVQLQDDGADLGGSQTVDAGGHASITDSSLAVGAHPVTADFTSSTADVAGSSGGLAGGPVLFANLQIVTPADTTTGVSTSGSPSQPGAAVIFTATTTANSPSQATPAGTVQFQDNGTNLGSPQSLDATGHASISRTDLSVGSHTIGAIFTSGSASFHASTGNVNQTVERAPTTLTYDGVTSADFDDPAVLSARLTRTIDSSPVAGEAVTLTMGSESCLQVTNAAGEAACTITPSDVPGSYTVTAGFSGDAGYQPSADSDPFTVTREQTVTAYTGVSGPVLFGSTVTLSGVLKEDGVTPIGGRLLTMTLGSGTSAQHCLATTSAAGSASCPIAVNQPVGLQAVSASFGGDTFYLPSTGVNTVKVFTALSLKKDVLAAVITLRTTANRRDGDRLKDVVAELTDAVDPSRWGVDGNHLRPKRGDDDFDREKDAAAKLEELICDRYTVIPAATLQPLVDTLVHADQILANTAIADATAAGGDRYKLVVAQWELAAAAYQLARGHFADAIDLYGAAWHSAEEATHSI